MNVRWILLIALALALLIGGGITLEQQYAALHRTTPDFDRMQVKPVALIDDLGQQVSFDMRIADDVAEQEAGFQYIGRAVLEQTLILFAFSSEFQARFHMRHVVAPLDIAFVKADGSIIDIETMVPDPTTAGPYQHLYGPDQPFQYAIEAREGFFKEHHISVGKAKLIVGSGR